MDDVTREAIYNILIIRKRRAEMYGDNKELIELIDSLLEIFN